MLEGRGATRTEYQGIKQGLHNILEYTEHLLATRIKVISDIDKEAVARFHEGEVAGLEGVEINADQETWLSIIRIRESKPPQADIMFEGWVDFGSHPTPDVIPTLRSERVVRMSIEDISEHFEAGIIINPDDIMALDETAGDEFDVILRTANMSEFCDMWREYVDGPWARWAEVERPRRRSIDTYNRLYQIHQRMTAFGEDTPVEMVFGLGIARWRMGKERINVPLIEQSIELEMDEAGTITVRPRQLMLERLGWTFWRCWGSSWYVDPDGCLADLCNTLNYLGIEPLGMTPVTTVYTEHITISSPESSVPADISTKDTTLSSLELDVSVPPDAPYNPVVVSPSGSYQKEAASHSDTGRIIQLAEPVNRPRNPASFNESTDLNNTRQYVPAAFSDIGVEPRPNLLYESEYNPTLRRLVAHVITVEGPIYGDILAMRIARAHGKDRTGSTIQKLVFDAVDHRFPTYS
jgi:hypothetical protein